MGSIMNKCRNCQIEIVDDTMICPLCKTVVEKSGEDQAKTPMYPEVIASTQVMKMVGRIYLFIAIACEAILLIINYFTYTGVKWSLICGCAFLYCFLTLKFSLDNRNAGLRSKILNQSLALAGLLILVDHIIGILAMVFESSILLVLSFAHVVQHPILSFIAFGVSILEFGLTFLIGGKNASNELRRKFYI